MKRLRAPRQPVTHCTPFRFLIGPMSMMAEIFLGFCLDVALRHDKAKEHAPRNPENALLDV
jgi:hypothetical protein